ncbi:MAG TPA: hypothetical protein V6D48_21870 [Oculatellaceae cyanobacterium]
MFLHTNRVIHPKGCIETSPYGDRNPKEPSSQKSVSIPDENEERSPTASML